MGLTQNELDQVWGAIPQGVGLGMANLRGGVVPCFSTGWRRPITRLASRELKVFADTWNRHVEVWLSKDGRCSIVVKDGSYQNNEIVAEIELPCNEGDSKDAFQPLVKFTEGFETIRL